MGSADDRVVAQGDLEAVGDRGVGEVGQGAEEACLGAGMRREIGEEPAERHVVAVEEEDVGAEDGVDVDSVAASDACPLRPVDRALGGVAADDDGGAIGRLVGMGFDPADIDPGGGEGVADHGALGIGADERGDTDVCAEGGQGDGGVVRGATGVRGGLLDERATTSFGVTLDDDEVVPRDDAETGDMGDARHVVGAPGRARSARAGAPSPPATASGRQISA